MASDRKRATPERLLTTFVSGVKYTNGLLPRCTDVDVGQFSRLLEKTLEVLQDMDPIYWESTVRPLVRGRFQWPDGCVQYPEDYSCSIP